MPAADPSGVNRHPGNLPHEHLRGSHLSFPRVYAHNGSNKSRGDSGDLMISKVTFWPCFAGAIFFLVGMVAVWKESAEARGWDKVILLGRIFVAAPLAIFSAEHFVIARAIMEGVPAWMPFRLFWAYFVGVGLLAAAVSLTLKRQLRLTATLLALMFFIFVLTIHLPNLAAHLHERLFWTIALRDACFGAGALALASATNNRHRSGERDISLLFARLIIATALVFFAAQQFLYPHFAPGVPLPKLTPSWVPLAPFWSYLCGAVLLFAAVTILLNKHARQATAMAGLLMAFFTFLLYLPILLMNRGVGPIIEGVNYVGDTLLFGGALLLLALALPRNVTVRTPALS